MNRIALFGYGIVGRGVKELIDQNENFTLVKVFGREHLRGELGDLLETDYHRILADSSIDTIVECLGGDTPAYPIIWEALHKGKNVVSSNKETLSRHLREFINIAKDNNVKLAFESAVGGGIPLLYPLSIQADFDIIHSIKGILNATCNFILTKMQKEGMGMKDAVKFAQDNGFAEKDPSADLMGLDMVRKGNIVASIISHKEFYNSEIPHYGIENLSQNIIQFIKDRGRSLRFVVEITFLDKDNVTLNVLPIAITDKNPLIHVEYETNGVLVEDAFNGPITFLGKGAGRYPTASAVMQDLVRIQKGIAYPYERLRSYQPIKSVLKGKFLIFNDDHFIKEVIDPTQAELLPYDFICKEES